MGNYIDPTDVDNWPSGAEDAEQAAIVKKAEELIEEGCEDIFYEKPFDIDLNGNDRSRLFVPTQRTIITVGRVHVDGVEIDPSWWAYDKNSVFVDVRASMNEIQDGEFEKWLSASDLTYWIGSTAGTSTISRDSTYERTGTYCLALNVDALNSDVYTYQDFTMAPNREYTLGLYYFMSVVAKTGRWMLRDMGSNVYLTSTGSWTDTATWNTLANQLAYTAVSIDFRSYPLYGNFRLYLDRLVAASSTIYFDDVEVQHKEGTGITDPEYIYRMRGRGALFPHGYNNCRVEGTYGWSTTPQAIKQAAIIYCKWENDPDLYSTLFKSEKIGDYSYQLGTDFKSITGILQADQLLQNYINKDTVVMAA